MRERISSNGIQVTENCIFIYTYKLLFPGRFGTEGNPPYLFFKASLRNSDILDFLFLRSFVIRYRRRKSLF